MNPPARGGQANRRLVLALHERLLRCYPPAFRHRFGAEIAAAFVRRLDTARSPIHALAWTALTLFDVVASGLTERLAGRGRASVGPEVRPPRSLSMRLDTLLTEFRFAARQLRRAPLFALTAVASLAIGIGANTTIFSAANALLLAPTPGIHEMDRLVDIGATFQGRGFDNVSYPTYADLRARATSLEGLYAMRLDPQPMSLGGGDGAERIYGGQVSASYFDVLGLRPAAGTFFRSDEEELGTPLRKVVLSHVFWQRRFGGDHRIVGDRLVLNGDAFVVAGIAPEGYSGSTILAPDVWVPLTAYARATPSDNTLGERRDNFLIMGARLRPGVSIAQAQAELDALQASLLQEHPEAYQYRGLSVMRASRLPGEIGELFGLFLLALFAVVGLVLLIACTNLAGLMLARATARRREVAVRLALGAPRAALVRQLLAESLLVFALGGMAALALAHWMTQALWALLPSLPVQVNIPLALDWRVLAFTAGVSFVASMLTGLVPAFQGSRADLVADIKDDATAPRRQRLRQAYLMGQVALCLVLLVSAGLFIRALEAAVDVDPGFDVDNIRVASLDLSISGYPREQTGAVIAELERRFQALPQVELVGAARVVPLEGSGLGLGSLRAPGVTDPTRYIRTDWNVVTAAYLPALDMPLVAGRNFNDADRAGQPLVAIVNERLAEQTWPGESPVGRVLENGDFRPGREATIREVTVVGVARDAKYRWLGEEPSPHIYVPFAQHPRPQVSFFLRSADGARSPVAMNDVRMALQDFDPDLPLVRFLELRDYANLGLLPQRVAASVAASLGVVALLLAGVGIYGVMAFWVARRTRELGVRTALGADPGSITWLVLRQSIRIAAIGGAVGLLLAAGAAQLISGLLFGVSPFDPVAFGTAAGALLAIALMAAAGPARRAARIDPLVALRAE